MEFCSKKLASILQKKQFRSVLFLTICIYYFKNFEFLFICMDVAQNPGPSTSGHFRFASWNANSLPAHLYQRISAIQAYISMRDLHLFSVSENALSGDSLTKLTSLATLLLEMIYQKMIEMEGS